MNLYIKAGPQRKSEVTYYRASPAVVKTAGRNTGLQPDHSGITMGQIAPKIWKTSALSARIFKMTKFEKLHRTIMGGRSDANISFEELRNLLIVIGFEERIKGSHHTFRKADVFEKPNL
jgi:hypothetical protein